jgi:MFS family permease
LAEDSEEGSRVTRVVLAIDPAHAEPTPMAEAFQALRHANYRWYLAGFLCSSLGLQMMGMALGWEIYERTRDPLMLGYLGVARALPVVVMALPAGVIIDHANRKLVLILTQIGFALASGLLAWGSRAGVSPYAMLGLVSLAGLVRSFNGPVRSSLLPDLVPSGAFTNAITWNINAFQVCAIAGPIIAGVVVLASKAAWPVYLCTSVLCLVFALAAMRLRPLRTRADRGLEPLKLGDLTTGLPRGMLEGMRHVWREKLVLSTITLDLLAVIFGGVTALIPVYCKEILGVSEFWQGVLRASPYAGALLMGLVLARVRVLRRAGPKLLWSVAVFGAATIVFGLSRWYWLSIVMLTLAGAADAVSVLVRHVLVSMRTPPELRGRVNAVNGVFIECSNELGSFESGLVARLVTPVFSAVTGGIGTLLVVAGVALVWPQLRRLDTIHEVARPQAQPGK